MSEQYEKSGRCHLKITNALIVDGSGNPAYSGDVAVEGDSIAAVGDLRNWRADDTVDVAGCVAAPGFIDVHTHDDLAALKTPDMSYKASQGVTTVIAGNCGLSIAPFESGKGFPPPFPVIGKESEFAFPSVADYRAELKKNPPSLNLALLAGHSSIRVSVMGESLNRAASKSEIDTMQIKLRAALSEGCIGMSTGLDYMPANDAPTDEVVALARVLSEFDERIYTTHMRNESDRVLEAVEETLEIGRRAKASVVISHHKCSGPKNYGRSVETLAAIERGRKQQAVGLDVYPYIASSTALLAKYIRESEKVLVAFSDPHPHMAGRELHDIAQEWDCTIEEAAEQLYPAGAVYFQMDETDLERIMAYPPTMIGSDGLPGTGKPHPRLWGTFPRVLGRYVREKNLLTLEQAVHKMTGLSAETFKIKNRGLIKSGYCADITIFNPKTVIDRASYDQPETPSDGIHSVYVNGRLVWNDGKHTGARSGVFLQG
ncbi:MAG: D-aminoacylase [Pseudomonadota bacterium]